MAFMAHGIFIWLGFAWVELVKFVIFRYFMQIMGTMSAKQPLTMLISPIIIHKSLPTNHHVPL